jgi:DNA replication licensing factor MCM4
MRIQHNLSRYANKQLIKMQESPGSIPEGETPHTVTMYAYDELVDTIKAGDKVEVVGVYRVTATRVRPQSRNLRSVYKSHLDIIHVRRIDASESRRKSIGLIEILNQKNFDQDLTEAQMEERENELRALAETPDLYEKLAQSIAPSIYGLDDIKKGVLCQLFGGVTKEFDGGKIRGNLNILLVGDPGMSKSQILGYANKLTPRGVYTSGRGSSEVGLTAYITKDPETRETVLESGALVLSDQGLCCIDEFDKMSESARSILHEVLEQQSVSVAKSGIVCSLNARTSVLASANPIGSKYNPKMSVIENIDLSPSLLSRFDLVYLMLDTMNETIDKKLARHLVSLFWNKTPFVNDLIDASMLKDYIVYAKVLCEPIMTDEACHVLVRGYLDWRSFGKISRFFGVSPRQLESLIRISEALARMKLSTQVIEKDSYEALRLFKSAMQEAAFDPSSGMIDMNILTTGSIITEKIKKNELICSPISNIEKPYG